MNQRNGDDTPQNRTKKLERERAQKEKQYKTENTQIQNEKKNKNNIIKHKSSNYKTTKRSK